MQERRPRSTSSIHLLTLLSLALLLPPLQASTPTPPDPPDSNVTEEVQVVVATNTETTTLDPTLLREGHLANLALAFQSIPGVVGVRRSQNAAEPVVRGLGWERVQTQVNGLPLYGACPARMDPPSTLVPIAATTQAQVIRGLGSVTLGPGGTGGRLRISTDYEHDAPREPGFSGEARFSFADARDGGSGNFGLRGGTTRFDYAFGVEMLDHDDYTTASGTTVPAAEEQFGGYASFGWRATGHQRWHLNLIAQDGNDIDYPSLPMDTEELDQQLANVGYRWERPGVGRGFSRLEVSLGIGEVDHVMSNLHRPNRGTLEAATRSNADSQTFRLLGDWLLGSRAALQAGFDVSDLERDALRRRFLVGPGQAFADHLWPDVSQDNLGVFAEVAFVPRDDWHLRVGLRFDDAESDAAAADDPSLGGRTIRENYAFYYGPQAARTDRNEQMWTGNLLASRRLSAGLVLEAGAGVVSRPASMTERYFAFAPAPNGFVVGNPSLAEERKRELSLGTTFDIGRVQGTAGVFHYAFDDYIYPTILETRDINGDGIDDVIRGFFNVDATLYGVDAAWAVQATDRLSLPMSLAYVHAENDDDGRPLPEIPPFEIGVAGRWKFGAEGSDWVEFGGRIVDRQHRIDSTFGEDETAGYAVWHLRSQITVARALQLSLYVDNLFDAAYNEHLTREAVGSGAEIDQPERSFSVSARVEF